MGRMPIRDEAMGPDAGPEDPAPVVPGSRRTTMGQKLSVAFAATFIIPTLLAVHLLLDKARVGEDLTRFLVMASSIVLLGAAGFLTGRSAVAALERAVRETEAIAKGDLRSRVSADSVDEISELAKSFNRITSRLQRTVDSLQASRRQVQSLLSQICDTAGRPIDVETLFDVLLRTLLSVAELDSGAIFLLSPDGRTLRVRAAAGLREEDREAVVPLGKGIVGWVASHGQLVTVSESMPWGARDDLTPLEASMPWAVHVPLGAPGRIRGVMSIGRNRDGKEFSSDDLAMIRNLAVQVSVAVENATLREDMERTYVEMTAALAAAVEARDRYTQGHSKRVTEFAVATAKGMGLPESFLRDLEAAALLHDIGKIGIPDWILHSRDPLPPEGVAFIREHPIGGEAILRPVGSLWRLCPIVRHHHEHYDGGGYPDGLKGEEIPLAARILAVADSFDAMISTRAYKATRSRDEAVKELLRCRGTTFDPVCVDALIAWIEENPESVACPAYPGRS
jgi:HD-GYP domain-containing protein (c-di-GMP phosphodiesterase class II)/HAMP domain-containing protein